MRPLTIHLLLLAALAGGNRLHAESPWSSSTLGNPGEDQRAARADDDSGEQDEPITVMEDDVLAATSSVTPVLSSATPTLSAPAIQTSLTTVPAPAPVITLVNPLYVTGQVICVNGLSTTLNGGSVMGAHYLWDFGDPSGQYNTMEGFNAAHVYDVPGTYTITLTVTNSSGGTATSTAEFTIANSSRKTYYFSAAGNDLNSGLTAQAPFKSFSKAQGVVADNVALLFRRGDRFDVSSTLSVNGNNVLISDYGDASKPSPVLRWTQTANSAFIGVSTTRSNVMVQDLTFDSIYTTTTNKSGTATALRCGGKNIAIRGCQFLHVLYGVEANASPTGLLIQDNTSPLDTGLRGYFAWIQGSNIVIVGNQAANSTREHIVRGVDIKNLLITNNDFANIDRTALGDTSDSAKATINLRTGFYWRIADNVLRSGPCGFGPLGGNDGLSGVVAGTQTMDQVNAMVCKWIICENNDIEDSYFNIVPGAQMVAIRNNTVMRTTTGPMINVNLNDPTLYYGLYTYTRVIRDLTILSNTGNSQVDDTQFVFLKGRSAGSVTLKKNLLIAPKLMTGAKNGAPLWITNPDLTDFYFIGENVWQYPSNIISYAAGGINYINVAGTTAQQYQTPAEWNAWPQVSTDYFEVNPLVNNRGAGAK